MSSEERIQKDEETQEDELLGTMCKNEILAVAITEHVAAWYVEYIQYLGYESLDAEAMYFDVYSIVKNILDQGNEI